MTIIMSFIVGAVVVAVANWLMQKWRLQHMQSLSHAILNQAEQKAKEIKTLAESTAREHELKILLSKQLADEQIKNREEKVERKLQEIGHKQSDLERREKQLKTKEIALQIAQEQATQLVQEGRLKLEHMSKLSSDEARLELLRQVDKTITLEADKRYAAQVHEIEKRVEKEATRLLVTALNRLTDKQIPESAIYVFELPSEELKAKIIGREGRNIRVFEQLTGVTIIVDDTPRTLLISSFNPERRQIARLALLDLIQDGRIHPNRIEIAVEQASKRFEQELLHYGQEAAISLNIHDLHPEILQKLGHLKLRNSLGQNILEHSIEVAKIMGLIAAELKLNVQKARRIGLLHDIGKGLADTGLSHALSGAEFIKRHGESEDIASGVGSHHDEMAATCLEGMLCKIADSISARREGARQEQIEKYITRLDALEKIASEYPGIETAYAMQAGRELRVFVRPEVIDDQGAFMLAKQLTSKIEESHTYSGKIQVTVIREKKIVDYAC